MPDPAYERDSRIRLAAFSALRKITERNGGVITRAEMTHGFEFEGDRIPFANAQVGIWRPVSMNTGPAAPLSITTAARRPGVTPRYDDEVREDGWFRYRYMGQDPNHWHNVALRNAFRHRVPLIYFYGITPGIFDPIFPVWIEEDHPKMLTVSVSADTPSLGNDRIINGGSESPLKEYATRTVKQRLHQRRFRELVVSAYSRRCAVCTIGTTDRLLRLLDAAHILPDHDERGLPEIPNGLSLCKIHHSAYDLNIMGIDPDHRVHVRQDILEQVDGPMLQHGLQKMHNQEIILPRREEQQPNQEYLAERFELFRAA
jgi:putative restriction endonuclease